MKKDRVFTTKDKDDKELVLRFKRPTQSALNNVELEYRVAFSRGFNAGVITNAQVDKALKDRGVWDESSEKKAEELRNVIINLEDKLDNPSLSDCEGKVICEEIERVRSELMIHNDIYGSISNNTCESMANEARNRLLCVECIVFNDSGLCVYKDVDDFMNRSEEQITLDSYRETVIASLEAITGKELSSDIVSEYAENKWMETRGLSEPDESEEETKVPKEEKKVVKKKVASRKKVSK